MLNVEYSISNAEVAAVVIDTSVVANEKVGLQITDSGVLSAVLLFIIA